MAWSPLTVPEIPRHYLAELEALHNQHKRFCDYLSPRRLSPEEEKLQRELEEYRDKFHQWVRMYMGSWGPHLNFSPKDPYHVIPLRPLEIPFRYCSLPQFSVSENGELPMATSTVTLGNMTVWQDWNTVYYQNSLEGSAQTAVNYYGTYGTAVTANDVWYSWNQYYQQATGMMAPPASQVREVTPEEQRQARELAAQQQEAARVAAVKREQERQEAQKKAKELLASALEKEQKDSFEKNGYFDVVVKDKTYRIKPGQMITMMDGRKREVCKYCIHPESSHLLPSEDVALSQKLLLEASEETFLSIANRHSV